MKKNNFGNLFKEYINICLYLNISPDIIKDIYLDILEKDGIVHTDDFIQKCNKVISDSISFLNYENETSLRVAR